MSRPRIYGFSTQNNGCGKYRVWQPLKALARTGLATIRREKDEPGLVSAQKVAGIFHWADVVYAQPSSDLLCTCLLLAGRDHHKKKLVMDLDDNIWAVHPLNIGPVNGKLRYLESVFLGQWEDYWELADYTSGQELKLKETLITWKDKEFILRMKSPDAKAAVELMLAECDAVTTTNPDLADVFRRHTSKPVHIVPNRLDLSEWKQTVNHDTDDVTIGWCGSVSHYPDLEPIVEGPLERLMTKYPKLRVHIMGSAFGYLFPMTDCQQKAAVPGYDGENRNLVYASIDEAGQRWPGRMKFSKPVDIQNYVPWMNADWHAQIGIAPIIQSEFNESKSELKWLEYTAVGAATVASKVGPYKRAICHNVDGKLCGSNGSWFKGLESLIADRELRKHLVTNARERLFDEYNAEKQAHQLLEILTA